MKNNTSAYSIFFFPNLSSFSEYCIEFLSTIQSEIASTYIVFQAFVILKGNPEKFAPLIFKNLKISWNCSHKLHLTILINRFFSKLLFIISWLTHLSSIRSQERTSHEDISRQSVSSASCKSRQCGKMLGREFSEGETCRRERNGYSSGIRSLHWKETPRISRRHQCSF